MADPCRPRCRLRRRCTPHCGRCEHGRAQGRRSQRRSPSQYKRSAAAAQQPRGGGGGSGLPRGGGQSPVAALAVGDGRHSALRDGRRQRRDRPACTCTWGQAKADSSGGGEMRAKEAFFGARVGGSASRSVGQPAGRISPGISRGRGGTTQPRVARGAGPVVDSAKPTQEGGSARGNAGPPPVRKVCVARSDRALSRGYLA